MLKQNTLKLNQATVKTTITHTNFRHCRVRKITILETALCCLSSLWHSLRDISHNPEVSGDQRSKHPRKSLLKLTTQSSVCLFWYLNKLRTTTLKVYLQIISISNYLTLIELSTHKYNMESYISLLKWYNRTMQFLTTELHRQCKVSQHVRSNQCSAIFALSIKKPVMIIINFQNSWNRENVLINAKLSS